MRLWHLSHRRPAKAQVSLSIRVVCQSLRCSHTWSMEVDEGSDQNIRHLAHWMAVHARLNNEFRSMFFFFVFFLFLFFVLFCFSAPFMLETLYNQLPHFIVYNWHSSPFKTCYFQLAFYHLLNDLYDGTSSGRLRRPMIDARTFTIRRTPRHGKLPSTLAPPDSTIPFCMSHLLSIAKWVTLYMSGR